MNAERYIDVSDLTDRAEELESAREALREEFEAMPENLGVDFDNWVRHQEGFSTEEADEMEALRDTLDELKGNGGDHQWRGDWYPAQLIHEDAFEEYMDEMLEDCGELPKNLPCYLKIEVDYSALQQDYTTIEIDGETYLYR